MNQTVQSLSTTTVVTSNAPIRASIVSTIRRAISDLAELALRPKRSPRTMVADGALSYSKILNVSSDQKILPLETFQPRLPVWLNLCASAKYISLCCSAPSTCF